MLVSHQQLLHTWRRDQRGFTLIELLVVLVIIGVLTGIAVPSYRGFKKRAERSAAQANVADAKTAMHLFYASNATYSGATLASLRAIDKGIASVTISGLSATAYTISFTKGSCWARVIGPGGAMSTNC